jgi:transcriptional regulator GlxA family with amidase domain
VRARKQITGIVGEQSVAATDAPARKFSEPEARRVMDYIHANIDRELSVVDLAQLAKISPRQFIRIFSNTFGTTPHRYILNERVAQACQGTIAHRHCG